ncbi:hypothetical protein DKX38_013705 [Salix brachista]|uniref:Uncharacterized protein n=1 Tax=Salix brachista TaxID=2182728 RepID=A0A5N5LF37_9ROSI|nr:hypothetical protein DKX38_013705 [Salix brachista]
MNVDALRAFICIWARTRCYTDSSGKFTCATATGGCVSGRAECHGTGHCLVDGFNVPLSVIPLGDSCGCSSTRCEANVKAICDSNIAVKGSDRRDRVCLQGCSGQSLLHREIIQAQERTTFDELVGHKFKKYRISIATTISRMQNLHSTLMVSG